MKKKKDLLEEGKFYKVIYFEDIYTKEKGITNELYGTLIEIDLASKFLTFCLSKYENEYCSLQYAQIKDYKEIKEKGALLK